MIHTVLPSAYLAAWMLHRERGVKEQRDGRDTSDVYGFAARDDAHEELRGEVEEAGGRRLVWRGSGGGGGGGEAARAAARRGGVDIARKRILQANSLAQSWARDWRALALTQVHH